MLYYIGSQNGIILQQVGDTVTKQILLWDNIIFQRHINFSDSSKTHVSSISSWWKLGATHISYDSDTRKFHLQDMNYKNLNPTVDSEVPLASSTQDGFMSKKQVQKLEDSLSILSTKQDALSPGDGITMMNNTVSTLIGNGLTYNGREIVIDHDLTLKTNNGKLGVNAGDGLYVNPDNELGINVGKGLAINHTDSTVEVAEEVLNDITIKSGTGTNSSLQINAPGSKASGTNSLAVGMDAVASGDYSIAMGRGCSATGRGSVALGGTIISIKLTGDKGAVRYQSSINSIIAEYLPGFSLVKTSDLTTPIATITASEVIDDVVYITVNKTLSSSSALSNTTFGLIGNKASGGGSIALGAGLLSSNQNSIAEGWVTVAAGSYSHAEGSFNIAKGNGSHAEGGFNIAEGIRSHTEGYYTVAKAASSHAEGARSLASGDASHAEGYGTVASGDYSHAEGSGIYNIYLTGSNSTYQISYGGNVQNTFHFIRRCQGASIIEYTNFTKIAVINSIDLSEDGYTVTVVTDVDLGELSDYRCGVIINISSGQSSHTENAAQASGKESHAGGWSLSTNECSFSHGYDCVADGETSTSFGINTYSQNNSEFALGRSNHSHTGETLAEQTLFSVGCGDFEEIDMSKRIEQQLPLPTPEDGTNALEIMQNGDIWLGGYEEGVKLFEGETKELNTYTKEELNVELDSKIESEPVNTSITNIEESLVSSALRKTPQTLTEYEKEQARTNIEAQKELTLTVKDNGNIVISNIQGQTKEFMPATPSGDPMHYAYETAGAKYNGTTDFIVKDAPWKDMVDTIEDKAKWGFDVVDASQVKQMTINGTTYNYVQTTRQSPEGTTEPRYYIVGQASDGTWVEDETKVLHLPGHWYLNGLGDITRNELALIYENCHIVKDLALLRTLQTTNIRTFFPLKNGSWYAQFNSSALQGFYYSKAIEVVHILGGIPLYSTAYPYDRAPSINDAYGFTNNLVVKYLPQHRIIKTNVQTYKSATKLRVVPVVASQVSLYFSDIIQLSKNSILYVINNAAPTTPITITLHANRYVQLAEDADIIAALETKNTALSGTGGSISLVSA